MKPPKTPKIKTGKLSKKCFKKLQQAGTSFEYLPVPKELMPQFETAMKKMGGTFFTGGIEDNNNIYVAIPAAQRNMAALAAQHMLSKEIENKPDAFILKDGNNKISEEEMRITSDVTVNGIKVTSHIPEDVSESFKRNRINQIYDILVAADKRTEKSDTDTDKSEPGKSA